jgi:hypothetical protein
MNSGIGKGFAEACPFFLFEFTCFQDFAAFQTFGVSGFTILRDDPRAFVFAGTIWHAVISNRPPDYNTG